MMYFKLYKKLLSMTEPIPLFEATLTLKTAFFHPRHFSDQKRTNTTRERVY